MERFKTEYDGYRFERMINYDDFICGGHNIQWSWGVQKV
tara:strand:- start:219 stop:335 length:117 start_codon:yes stop_codon:yes gene_type:complete